MLQKWSQFCQEQSQKHSDEKQLTILANSSIGIPGRHFLARSEEMTYLLPFFDNFVHGKDNHKQAEADTNNAKGSPQNIHVESLSFQANLHA